MRDLTPVLSFGEEDCCSEVGSLGRGRRRCKIFRSLASPTWSFARS